MRRFVFFWVFLLLPTGCSSSDSASSAAGGGAGGATSAGGDLGGAGGESAPSTGGASADPCDLCDAEFETCRTTDGESECIDIDECERQTDECDDEDQLCENTAPGYSCLDPKVLFTSSGVWEGDLGGLSGADAKCQAAADAAELDGTFKAWLSDSSTDARDRLNHHPFRYELPTGAVVAEDWDDLVDGDIAVLINVDESGATHEFCNCSRDFARTGTAADGTKLAEDAIWCSDYTASSSARGPHYGRVGTYTDEQWTAQDSSPCNWEMRLICVEQ